MEYSQINALSKLGANDYDLWNLTLPREKIHEIRQAPESVSGDMRQIFDELPIVDSQDQDSSIQFVLPQGDSITLYTVDMGEDFVDRNRYNGSSVRGSREEIMVEFWERLKAQGYSLRPNAFFEDVDVISTLKEIMEHNTDFHQTDFQYDMEKLREAAEDQGGYRNFFWLTRKNGTWCFPERDVYIQSTNAANAWAYYGGCRDENVKAFWIELKRMEGDDQKIIGNVVEMDYQKHLDYLCTHSFVPEYVEVVFKSPNDVRIFTYQEYNQNWQSIGQRYGTVERVKFLVENQTELARAVLSARSLIWEAAKPMELTDYIDRLEHDRLHDYGYTADDMKRVGPMDADKAVQKGLCCYALHKNGTREAVSDRQMFQNHLSNNGLFGMEKQETKLLQYFKQDCIPLFTPEEMRLICSLAIQTGKEIGRGSVGLLDSIIYKAELTMGQAETAALEHGIEFDHAEQEDFER